MKIKELEYEENVLDLLCEMVEKVETEGFVKGISINTDDIIVSASTKDSCKYCTSFKGNFSCPPYSPNEKQVRELIEKYRHGLLLVIRISAPGWLVNMPFAGAFLKKFLILKNARKMHRMILGLQKLADEKGWFSDGFIAGKCLLHTKCRKLKGKRCESPEDRRYSMESLGIDVFGLSKRYGIRLLNKLENRFYYIGLLLARSKKNGIKKAEVLEIRLEEHDENIPYDYKWLNIHTIIKCLNKKYESGTIIISKNTGNNSISLDKLIEVIRKTSAVADYGYLPVYCENNFFKKIFEKMNNVPKKGIYVFIEGDQVIPNV